MACSCPTYAVTVGFLASASARGRKGPQALESGGGSPLATPRRGAGLWIGELPCEAHATARNNCGVTPQLFGMVGFIVHRSCRCSLVSKQGASAYLVRLSVLAARPAASHLRVRRKDCHKSHDSCLSQPPAQNLSRDMGMVMVWHVQVLQQHN
jgi:hypothetical protein